MFHSLSDFCLYSMDVLLLQKLGALILYGFNLFFSILIVNHLNLIRRYNLITFLFAVTGCISPSEASGQTNVYI